MGCELDPVTVRHGEREESECENSEQSGTEPANFGPEDRKSFQMVPRETAAPPPLGLFPDNPVKWAWLPATYTGSVADSVARHVGPFLTRPLLHHDFFWRLSMTSDSSVLPECGSLSTFKE